MMIPWILGAGFLSWALLSGNESDPTTIPAYPGNLDPNNLNPGRVDITTYHLADPNSMVASVEHLTPNDREIAFEAWNSPIVAAIPGSRLMQSMRMGNAEASRMMHIPFSLPQFERDPALINIKGPFTKPQVVNIDSWESFRFFGNMFAIAMLQIDSGDPKQVRIGEAVMNFLNYHAFQLHEGFRRQMAEIAVKASCKENMMLPKFSYRNELSTPNAPEHLYPAITVPAASKWTSTCKSFCSVDQQQRINTLAEYIGRNAIFEYGASRYMQIAFLSEIDPALAREAAQDLQKAGAAGIGVASSALGTLIAGLLGTAGAASAVPVVGWIGSAVLGIGAAITGLIKMFGAIDRTRAARMAINDRVEGYLKRYITTNPFTVSGFSGHLWHCVIPPKPFYDDIQTPLYQYFALGWTTLVGPPAPMGWSIEGGTFPQTPFGGISYAAPQLPFFYLGVDVPLPISLAQPSGNFLCLVPILKGTNGPTIGVRLVEYTQQDFANAIKNKR